MAARKPVPTMRVAAVVIAALGLGLLVRAQFVLEVPSADASGHYTDHLRHLGEALILVEHPVALYREPYGTLVPALGPEHLGLFPERTAPYTPLSVLLHWPLARLELAGVVSPTFAHRAVVWGWTLVALLACALVVRLFSPLPTIAHAWPVALALPLLVGIGVNGVIDSGYLLFGALACLAWRREAPVAALWWLALAAALNFRAAVFAPLAAAIAWRLFQAPRHPHPGRALASVALVVPSALAAFALAGTLGTIPADNPVHFTHLKLALAGFTGGSLAVAAWYWRQQEKLVAATVLAAFALAVLEQSHAWWHAGALLGPGLVLAARPPRVGWFWPVMLGWTLGGGVLAFRYPWSAFWQWVPYGLFGVH